MGNIVVIRVKDTLTFIQKSSIIHGEYYSYLKTRYLKNNVPVIITCPIHGDFLQAPINHTSGFGCPDCGRDRTSAHIRSSKNIPLSNIKEKIIGKTYGGTELTFLEIEREYVDSKSILSGHCSVHGNFKTTGRKIGLESYKFICPGCGNKSRSDKRRNSLTRVEASLRISSGGKYSPINLIEDYKTSSSKISMLCPLHGEFSSIYRDMVSKGTGCPKCVSHISSGEIELSNYISSIYKGEIVLDKKVLGSTRNFRPDILIPDRKISIEYNGVYFHSSCFQDKSSHKNKRIELESLGYRSIFIWGDEWELNKDKVKSYLNNILCGSENKIYARKCILKTVSSEDSNRFYEDNHLLGKTSNCKINLGLFYGGDLVCCMSFSKAFVGWELKRMCNKINFQVLGGFSRLLKNWKKLCPGEDLISYIDRDKFEGSTYFNLGFKSIGISLSMTYAVKGIRKSKFLFRKSRLLNIFPNVDLSLTEKNICENNNIYQCWNSGTETLILKC